MGWLALEETHLSVNDSITVSTLSQVRSLARHKDLSHPDIKEGDMENELIKAVLAWWKEHQYDVDISGGSSEDDPTEEYNRYDEEPDFVTIAKRMSAGEGK